MKNTITTIQIADFPPLLQPYLQNATIDECSSHSEATVLYLDTGYYLKIGQKETLAQEVQKARWFDQQGLGAPILHYVTTDKDYLLTRKALGQNALSFLQEPEQLCQTLARTLFKLHKLRPDNFPDDNRLQHYRQTAEENYHKGMFYEKALLPQFQLQGPEEAYQFIQAQGHLLTNDTFIHGDAVLPNLILHNASIFSCFIDVGLAGFSDRHIDLYWAIWSLTKHLEPKYAEYFMDYYG